MFIIDPNNPAAGGDSNPDAAAAAAEAAKDGQGNAPEPTAEEREAAEMAAIDKALAEPEGEGDAGKPEEGEKPKEGEEGTDGKPPVEKPGDKKPDAKEGEEGKPKPDTEAQDEANKLGLTGKANERFVAMSAEIKELRPMREALEKAGVKSVEDVAGMVQKSQAADSMIAMVMETGATEEQYGSTLDYLTMVNRAQKGDRQAAEKAFEMIGREYAELAKALGKEVAGVHDPLAEHADLKAEVESGDLLRSRALEIAGQRRQAALQQQAQQQNTQQAQQTQAQQQAITQGVEALRKWEADKLADPAYVALRPALSEQVIEIRKKFPPSQWSDATDLAYRALVAEVAAKQAPPQQQRKPAISAMRPGAGGNGLAPTKFASDLEAVDAALESL